MDSMRALKASGLSVLNPGPIRTAKQKYAAPDDWERVKPHIKRLYLDEKRVLRDVINIMATEYGHRGTIKMYRSRIGKWGWDKNKKKQDMIFVLHKTKQREALGKSTSFVVRGRVMTKAEVESYFQRTKDGASNEDPSEVPSTPPHISYRTPSPQPPDVILKGDEIVTRTENSSSEPSHQSSRASSWTPLSERSQKATSFRLSDVFLLSYMPAEDFRQSFGSSPELFHSVSSPEQLQRSEIMIFSIKSYFDFSFDSGTWITNEEGFCVNRNNSDTSSDAFNSYIYGARNLLDNKSFVEARRVLSKAFDLVPKILEAEKPSTLNSFLYSALILKEDGYEQVALMMLRHVRDTATVILHRDHPWRRICQILGMLEESQFEDALYQFWRCAITSAQNNLGEFHAMSTSYYQNYISRLCHSDPQREEQLTREMLARSEAALGTQSSNNCRIMYKLADNLCLQENWAEAEKVASKLIALSRLVEGQMYNLIGGLELIAEAQYSLGNGVEAEKSLREAIAMTIRENGRGDLAIIPDMTMLEGWLKEWDRGEEADELRREMEEIIGHDDIDKEFEFG